MYEIESIYFKLLDELDHAGVIRISVAGSGNPRPVLDRFRAPNWHNLIPEVTSTGMRLHQRNRYRSIYFLTLYYDQRYFPLSDKRQAEICAIIRSKLDETG